MTCVIGFYTNLSPPTTMTHPFFPDYNFGLVFGALLMAGLAVASWIDLKTLVVPKPVTLGLLAAGLLANVVRGVWLGSEGHTAWVFGPAGGVGGGFDGLLFAIAGLLVGFVVFFLLWIFGVCGGGDVKLAAAVGAWVGPSFFFGVLVLAVPVVILLTMARLGVAMLRGRPKTAGGGVQAGPGLQWRLMSYSLPMTIAVGVLLLFGFGIVQLAPVTDHAAR